ncbi:hypothetical protein JANAI62_07790 [Jannaschia pagri]|uniref:Uncharacterized protein n=1 Tax=Jannaschia pagri TaxID=2829797 RepID=A0ABQ4NIL3_9RHOB|nr:MULTISPECIES: hypothetical protein [unclassified Jannaschia]GIT89736.1 hypothetical protein JANAI61_01940 [Jannaschia sp. AI_61]GIT94156.1 hypothetical protein JANAI62_07790 [Jannaschia sp. AI_62]
MILTLPPRDTHIHVFSVSDGPLTLAHQTYLSRLSSLPAEATPLAEAFGAPVDATYVEVFALSDIAPMSLTDYLAQAHDVAPAPLSAHAARLDALSGDVVILAPGALEAGGDLTPRSELTHIARLPLAEADNAPRDLPPAAKDPSAVEPRPSSGRDGIPRRIILWIVAASLLLAAALLLVL